MNNKILLAIISFVAIGSTGLILFNDDSIDTTVNSSNNSLTITSSDPSPSIYHTVKFDTDGGTIIDDIQVKHGERLEKPIDPVRRGYNVDSWKLGTVEWIFSSDVVTRDITLKANWILSTYHIYYNLDGGKHVNPVTNSFNIENSFELDSPVKEDNVFLGWFTPGNTLISSIEPGTAEDVYVKAKWNDYLVLKSLDESKGIVSAISRDGRSDHITVKTKPINNRHHVFLGWFDENNKLLSTNEMFDVDLHTEKTNYIYSKYMDDEEEDLWNKSHGVTYSLETVDDLQFIYFGLYPQNVVDDKDIISKLNAIDDPAIGDYYYLDHEYYKKFHSHVAESMVEIAKFDNGKRIFNEFDYWFKVKSIRWRVITSNETSYYLMCDSLLEKQKFYRSSVNRELDGAIIYPNNYEYSDVREFLNADFYNSAFIFNNEPIIQAEIDNSIDTTSLSDERLVCNNTFDYVHIPSYSDVISESYTDRLVKTTDFSRCQSTYFSDIDSHLYTGYYWTRSPISPEEDDDKDYLVSRVNKNATINYDWVGDNSSCVRACIYLSKN